MNQLIEKLDQLRALLTFGQQAMPFIEELFTFIREVAPLMEEINTSLRDSTGKIPRATTQIQSVSQATELATTEILDLVESALRKLGDLEKRLDRSSEHARNVAEVDERLIALLRRELAGNNDELLADVERLHAQKQQLDDTTGAEVAGEQELLDAVRREVNQIMMALQVQDITSQQLAAVNHLIESIRAHLTQLLRRLDNDDAETAGSVTAVDDGTFNPDAVFDRSGRLQDDADAIADAYRNGDTLPDVEIDRHVTPPASGPASTLSDDTEAPAVQEDTDGLVAEYSNGVTPDTGDPEPDGASDGFDEFASQDDIDRLFENGL